MSVEIDIPNIQLSFFLQLEFISFIVINVYLNAINQTPTQHPALSNPAMQCVPASSLRYTNIHGYKHSDGLWNN